MMMTPLHPIPWHLLAYMAAYFGLILLISSFFATRAKTLKDYFLAGRNLGSLPVAISFVAACFGAGSTLGSINAFHDTGMSAFWEIVLPVIGSCLVVTFCFSKRIADRDQMSQPEAIAQQYGRVGRFLLSLVILTYATAFIGSQMIAAGKLFQAMLGMDIVTATLVITGIVVLYTMVGGYLTVVMTDYCQFFLFGTAVLVLLGFTALHGLQTPHFIDQWVSQRPAGFWDWGQNLQEHLFLFITFVLAWSIAPEMWQRMSSTQNREQAFRAAGLATICLTLLYLGVTGIGLLSTGMVSHSKLVLVDLAYMLPHEGLMALVLVGVTAAMTSTMDSSLNVGSLTLTRDLYQGFCRPQASDRELLWVSRISTVLIAIPAMIIALYFQDFIHVLWIASDVYAATMFVPVVGLLFLKNPGRLSGVLAMAFGWASTIVSALVQYGVVALPFAWPNWPYSTLLGVGLSAMGFGLGVALERQRRTSTRETKRPVPAPGLLEQELSHTVSVK